MSQSPVVLLEFNELCPKLMHRFMAEQQLPHFQRLYRQSNVHLTDAGEKAPNLEPWIQWVTVHTGVPFSIHKIFDLGDGHLLKHPSVWDLLSRAGRKVWICGSMNARYEVPLNGSLLPDLWTAGTPPYPASLALYLKFVRASVHEHTNDAAPFRPSDAAKFVAFMAGHGLSVGTVAAIARQLATEKGSRNRWKRSTILDRLQFDVFSHFYRKLRPDFSTFFLNSTAHLQHMYWRNMEPALFKVRPSEQEQAEFTAAILFGYKQMDDLLGRILKLVGSHATVIFSTALSQQPCLIYDDMGGKILYRARNFDRLLSWAGLKSGFTVVPVMAEQVRVEFESEQQAAEAEQRLTEVRVGEQPALYLKRHEATLLTGCCINHALPASVALTGPDGNTIPFFDFFYQMEGIKSGMHHSDGMLWISTPDREHSVHSHKVPLTAIAPMILEMFDVPAPSYMKNETLEESSTYHEAAAASSP